jgi:hypothetical protein
MTDAKPYSDEELINIRIHRQNEPRSDRWLATVDRLHTELERVYNDLATRGNEVMRLRTFMGAEMLAYYDKLARPEPAPAYKHCTSPDCCRPDGCACGCGACLIVRTEQSL